MASMGTRSVLTRNPGRGGLVEQDMMTVVRGGADLLDEVKLAAEDAFENAYCRGEDELHAALRAVDPLTRRDELDRFLQLLRAEIGQITPGAEIGGVTAGLYRAIDLLEHRKFSLIT
jgi:hypothetical protein